VHLVAVPEERQCHHGRARRDLLPALGPVVGHLAAELVTEHHPLIGAHEAVVAGLSEHLGRLIGVVAGVQVRPADAATQHVDEHLALARHGRWQIDELELRVLASDRLHAATRLMHGDVLARERDLCCPDPPGRMRRFLPGSPGQIVDNARASRP